MPTSSLKEYFSNLIPGNTCVFYKLDEVKNCELILRFSTSIAFFRSVKEREDLIHCWRQLQDEIAHYINNQHDKIAVYLVMMLEGKREKDWFSTQRILANPYVCRKIVIADYLNKEPRQVIEMLPFFPLPNSIQERIGKAPFDPRIVASEAELKPDIVNKLQNRISASTIAQELIDGEYDSTNINYTMNLPEKEYSSSSDKLLYLKSLKLSGFRNYGDTKDIPLSGRIIAIYGKNGTGKTSLCEAIEWALTGNSSRLQKEVDEKENVSKESPLLNLIDNKSVASVELELSGEQDIRIERKLIRGKRQTILKYNEAPIKDAKMLQSLLVDASALASQISLNFNILRQYHFLSQDIISDFLSKDPKTRYLGYTSLIGTDNLQKLRKKAEEVCGILHKEESRLDQQAKAINDLIVARNERKTLLQNNLQGSLIDESYLIEKTNQLVSQGERIGIQLQIPNLPALEHAQWVSESVLAICNKRLLALEEETKVVNLLAQNLSVIIKDSSNSLILENKIKELQITQATNKQKIEKNQQEIESALELVNNNTLKLHTEEAKKAELNKILYIKRSLNEIEKNLEQIRYKIIINQSELESKIVSRETNKDVVNKLNWEYKTTKTNKDELSTKLHCLSEISRKYDSWTKTLLELKQIDTNISETRENKDKVIQDLTPLEEHLEKIKDILDSLKSEYEKGQRVLVQKEALVTQIRSLINYDDVECPLCRHNWNTSKNLINAIDASLELLPQGMKHLQKQIDEYSNKMGVFQKNISDLKLKLTKLDREINVLEDLKNKKNNEIVRANREISDVLPEMDIYNLNKPYLTEVFKKGQIEYEDLLQKIEELGSGLPSVQEVIFNLNRDIDSKKTEDNKLQDELNQLESNYQVMLADIKVSPFGKTSEEAILAEIITIQENINQITRSISEITAKVEQKKNSQTILHQTIETINQDLKSLNAQFNMIIVEKTSFESSLNKIGILSTTIDGQELELQQRKDNLIKTESLLKVVINESEHLKIIIDNFKTVFEFEQLKNEIERLEIEVKGIITQKRRLSFYSGKMGKLVRATTYLKSNEDGKRLVGYEPIMSLLYQRLASHPFFGPLDIDINSESERVYIRFKLSDKSDKGSPAYAVTKYFSMAQANAVALSIFLGTALMQPWSKLGFVCIDDPVQHMDDMNIYSFLDLIQTIQESGRQIIITTASEDLYRTMIGRYVNLNKEGLQIFQAFRLLGASASGPEIHDDTPIKLADLENQIAN